MGGGGGAPQPIYIGQDPIPVSPFAWLYNRQLPPEGPAELYPPKGQPSSGDGPSIMPVPVRPSPGIPPVATGPSPVVRTQPTQRRRMSFEEMLSGFASGGGVAER